MPAWLSLGFVLGIAGAAYVTHTVWTFYGIYFPAWCSLPASSTACIHPKFPCDQTDLRYEGWITRTERFPEKSGAGDAVQIFQRRSSGCDQAWEDTFSFDVDPIFKQGAALYVHVMVLPSVRGTGKDATGKLLPSNENVVYQKVVMTKFMHEERTAMNLIQAGSGDGNSTSKYAL